jgi:predicted nucleic acid-binding protein
VALSYLVDTSVVTRLRVGAVRARVEALDAVGVARSSITDLEVGFSAQSATEWDRLIAALDVFDHVEIGPAHFTRARQVQRMLAERGLKGRKVPDLLIAAAGEATQRTILHYDADFDHIASVTGQSTEWVVPRGTID